METFSDLDQTIDQFLEPISQSITGIVFWEIGLMRNSLPLIVIWLVSASIFFTFYFKFINITELRTGLKVALGKFDRNLILEK